jgi:hypothetical protein
MDSSWILPEGKGQEDLHWAPKKGQQAEQLVVKPLEQED